MSSLLPSSSIVVAAKRTSQYPLNFLEVIRFSFPVPVVGPSDPTLSHAFAASENIKNLPLALRSRDKLWASRGYPSLPELRHAFLPHKRWEDCETIAAWLSQSPLACPLQVPCLPPHPLTSLRASRRLFDTRLKRGRENSRLHLDLSPSTLSISLLSP